MRTILTAWILLSLALVGCKKEEIIPEKRYYRVAWGLQVPEIRYETPEGDSVFITSDSLIWEYSIKLDPPRISTFKP
jgi:hypothetical protein